MKAEADFLLHRFSSEWQTANKSDHYLELFKNVTKIIKILWRKKFFLNLHLTNVS